MSHTKEPWLSSDLVSDGGDYMGSEITSVIGDSMRIADTLGSDNNTSVDRVNACRIVACVNACAGMNPDALPKLIDVAERMSLFLGSVHQNPALFIMQLDSLRLSLEDALLNLKKMCDGQ